jgi:hemoglobin
MKTSRHVAVVSAFFIASVGYVACKKQPPKAPETTVMDAGVEDAADEAEAAAPKSLYERLGGKDAIKSVVDKLVENIKTDNRVNKTFAKLKGDKLDKFKGNLADQICEVAGAPKSECEYKGRDMKTAHKGLKITDAQFDALVADLDAAMLEAKVPDAERKELLEKLAPTRDDIVEKKAPKNGKH